MITAEQMEQYESEYAIQHFLLGGVTPIKVLLGLDDPHRKFGAIAPDPTTGDLVFRNDLLSRIEESPEVDEIDEETFNQKAAEFYQKKTPAITPVGLKGPF